MALVYAAKLAFESVRTSENMTAAQRNSVLSFDDSTIEQFLCMSDGELEAYAAACGKLHSDDEGSTYEVKSIETTTVTGKELMKLLMTPVDNE